MPSLRISNLVSSFNTPGVLKKMPMSWWMPAGRSGLRRLWPVPRRPVLAWPWPVPPKMQIENSAPKLQWEIHWIDLRSVPRFCFFNTHAGYYTVGTVQFSFCLLCREEEEASAAASAAAGRRQFLLLLPSRPKHQERLGRRGSLATPKTHQKCEKVTRERATMQTQWQKNMGKMVKPEQK